MGDVASRPRRLGVWDWTTVWLPRDRSQRVPPQQDAILDNELLRPAQVSSAQL